MISICGALIKQWKQNRVSPLHMTGQERKELRALMDAGVPIVVDAGQWPGPLWVDANFVGSLSRYVPRVREDYSIKQGD